MHSGKIVPGQVTFFKCGNPCEPKLAEARPPKHSQRGCCPDTYLVPSLYPGQGSLRDDIYVGKAQGLTKFSFCS